MTHAQVVTDRAEPAVAPRPERPQWLRFWQSPQGQPAWARPALLAIAALAAVLYSWHLTTSGYATYYSVAVKSMSVSWKAFLYGALDPGATITIDKLAGSFVPQALSARIFGYHQWSLTLPQVIEGVVAVLVMYRVVRRWLGPAAGLIAAGLFTLTPITASMFGHPMEDGMLTMCLVLAADAFQRAVLTARLRSLLWAGFWVGVGFQAKMLQAWIVLPALAITYLLLAPTGWRRRLGHLAIAGAVMVAVSLSWVLLYTVTPAADRPFVDGSSTNNAFSMVFGYNGLSRFGVDVPGAVQSMFTGGGGTEWTKLLSQGYATQVGWLYPLALLALGYGLVRDRRDPGFVLWGLWLATFAAVFSRISIPHTAYMASLAPPVAALSAAGIVLFWRGYRDGTARWALPVAIVAEVAWTVYLARQQPAFLSWLVWVVVGVGVLALAVLLLARRLRNRLLVAGLVAGVVAMVAVPSAWAGSVLDSRYAGSAFDASAGPGGRSGPGGFTRAGNDQAGRGTFPPADGSRQQGAFPPGPGPAGAGGFPGGPSGPGGPGGGAGAPGAAAGPGGGSDTLTAAQQTLVDYLEAHRDGARFVAATDSWTSAGSYIMATGLPFMPMGGFSGSVPQPTLAEVQSLVATGELHYFLLGGQRMGRGGGDSTITVWVQSTCTTVPVTDTQSVYRCDPS
ncbi:4-amino-4-deoxy-L-arabinose transferase-like glycosyltransferase [Asanoa ferruginea]|uniref:4-amino-4-deoxy-L-arabinose transferase-like glycosyltransferase n=1 Tax=Asanoa ferruginea TaxID=53367 RepID=A0A3D9ZR95_9ACTN|nr:glycosyltransferase family 39 protein [Asanoa ferruginea]REF99399.1 4-amino-4-deoxy-L-arabinose transferase-like glycosyltransferase [Asanoa ferruginea]GIF46003.1 glycosyl transferase [Asanoa ferruginea]